jgi:hypothetical protein
MSNRVLVLDDADATAYVAARIQERQEQIQHNVAKRKAARQEKAGKDAKAEKDAAATAEAKVTAKTAAKAALHAAIKAKHGATATYAEEVFDHGQGRLILREHPEMKVQGRPAVERKRLTIPDADCDVLAATYAAECTASDQATNVQRQIDAFIFARPLYQSVPGTPDPEPEALLALRTALDGYVATVQTERARGGEIVAKVLAGESAYSVRVDIATGEIVLGDKPVEV